jgi:hypothetical protein
MKKMFFLWIALAIVVLMPLNDCTAQAKPGEWQEIFNGKDLTGWKALNGKHKWEVRDSVIVGTDVQGEPNGFLCTINDYGDFILELEVFIDTLMNNSGVQFRTRSTADYLNGRVHGYQMEVDPKPQQWSGSIYDEGGQRGWLYTTELNAVAKHAFKNNQWNKYRIECFGTSNRTWVNGIAVANLVDTDSQLGFIGLQLHANNPMDPPGSHEVKFRHIRIKTSSLVPSAADSIFVVNTIPNNLSTQEKKTGFALLWDGQTLEGWKKTEQQSPAGHVAITENTLNLESSAVERETEMTAFILKFDFRLSPGTRAGVSYLLEGNKKGSGRILEYRISDDSAQANIPLRKLGALTDLAAPGRHRFSYKKTGDWNQGIIKVFPGGLVEHWVNGFRVVSYQLEAGKSRKMIITLASQTGKLFMRSIKITKL